MLLGILTIKTDIELLWGRVKKREQADDFRSASEKENEFIEASMEETRQQVLLDSQLFWSDVVVVTTII